MGEAQRLGNLQVRVAGHDHVDVELGEVDEYLLQLEKLLLQLQVAAPEPQPEVGRHLVVAAACRVQLPAHGPDPLGECPLDVHVDILELDAPVEVAGLDLGLDLAQASHDLVNLGFAQDALFAQHRRVSHRALDVLQAQLAVDVYGGVELLDECVGVLRKAAAPHPLPAAHDGSAWRSCHTPPTRLRAVKVPSTFSSTV